MLTFIAVTWLRRSVASLSPRRLVFDPRSVHVRFVVEKVSVGQVPVPVLLFPPVSTVPPLLHTHPVTYMLLLPEGQTGEAWEPSKMQCSIGNSGSVG